MVFSISYIILFALTRFLHGRGSISKTAALVGYFVSTAAYFYLHQENIIISLLSATLATIPFITGWTPYLRACLDGIYMGEKGDAVTDWIVSKPIDEKDNIRLWGAFAMSTRWAVWFAPLFILHLNPYWVGLALVGPIYCVCGILETDSNKSNRYAEPLTAGLAALLIVLGAQ